MAHNIISDACTSIKRYRVVAMNAISTQANSAEEDHCTTTSDSRQGALRSPINASSQMVLSPACFELIADNDKLVRLHSGLRHIDDFLGQSVHHLQYWKGSEMGQREMQDTCATVHLVCYHQKMSSSFIVLCMLHLGLFEQDLAFRFGISQVANCVKDFITWVNCLVLQI